MCFFFVFVQQQNRYSLELEQSCAANSVELLRKELDRALFDEVWQLSPR